MIVSSLRPSRALPAEQKFSNDKLRAWHSSLRPVTNHRLLNGVASQKFSQAETEDPFAKVLGCSFPLVLTKPCATSGRVISHQLGFSHIEQRPHCGAQFKSMHLSRCRS